MQKVLFVRDSEDFSLRDSAYFIIATDIVKVALAGVAAADDATGTLWVPVFVVPSQRLAVAVGQGAPLTSSGWTVGVGGVVPKKVVRVEKT
jgi:hypothetical protein